MMKSPANPGRFMLTLETVLRSEYDLSFSVRSKD
jgi:hypothetical protein